MKEHHSFLENQKTKIDKEELLPPEVFRFYKDFFKAQYDVYEQLRSRDVVFPRVEDALPLLDANRFAFPDDTRVLMKDALRALSGIIEKHNSGLDFSSLIASAESEPIFMENLAMKLLARERDAFQEISGEHRIDVDELIFLLVNWLKPYVVLFAERNSEAISFDEWEEGRCPVCGYYPDMALLKDALEGKRFLHCALCETEWPYKRLACTICGEEQAEKLGYFALEEDGENANYRVDYCDTCHGYIKTRRISKGTYDEDYDLTVENILTIGFDSSLIEKGYTRP
jgi:FdhE protein